MEIKHQWIKTNIKQTKISLFIFPLFLSIDVLISSLYRFATTTRVQRNTDSTDATDLFFSRMFYLMHMDYVRLSGAWIFTLSLQKNATQSHKLQNNQGKSMIAEDSFVPLL